MKPQPLSEDLAECGAQRADAILELSERNPTDTQPDWSVGIRWIVALSVIAWLIVLAAYLLASRGRH